MLKTMKPAAAFLISILGDVGVHPLADFYIARARALTAGGRGQSDAAALAVE